MTYGHAERNLAFIRQLEAETQKLRVGSAVGHVAPSDEQLQGDDEGVAREQAAAAMLGPVAVSTLDQWLDLHTEIASGSDADSSRPMEQRTSSGNSDGWERSGTSGHSQRCLPKDWRT